MELSIHILDKSEEMVAVERLHQLVWPGSDLDVIPSHLLLAIARNGGLVIGAYADDMLVGFVVGFTGFEGHDGQLTLKHASHELAVHPDYRQHGIGFALKRAQWQMVRHQGIEHITWTYDPLLSKNAHLNIARLGGICHKYYRDYYGQMRDGLNSQVASDRFIVDWWVNSRRVENRLSRKARRKLDLAHYLAAGVTIINPSRLDDDSLPRPDPPPTQEIINLLDENYANHEREPILLVEIPADYQNIRQQNMDLAVTWRDHTRMLFEAAFQRNYLVTDFIHLEGQKSRSFYVLSKGDITLGGEIFE
jgi:predicted GNAT superfamily acetyltransferase